MYIFCFQVLCTQYLGLSIEPGHRGKSPEKKGALDFLESLMGRAWTSSLRPNNFDRVSFPKQKELLSFSGHSISG